MNSDDTSQVPEEEKNESALDAGSELEIAKAEASDWRDKYLRKLAEFDNFRKRSRQELASLRDMAAEDIILSVLPIVDDFDRLLKSTDHSADDPYDRAVEMIYGKVKTFLDSRGVVKFECVGKPFDPALHDAMLMQPTPDFPAGTVLAVMTPGYKMGDRVIRHAQVIVSGEPERESGTDNSANQ
jgi:molecular chaperone GrpE